eukprot:15329758-Ditylum_brightwellii.AAC.1
MSAFPPNDIKNKLQHSVTNSVAPEQYSRSPQLTIMGPKSRPPPPHPHSSHIKHRPSARQQSLCHLLRKTGWTRVLGSLYIVTPPIRFTQNITESINYHL